MDFRSHPEPLIIHVHRPVEESMSRTLDRLVAAQEMPYGYDGDGPPADTGNFNQAAKEQKRGKRG
jgi:hypothetical protein